MSNTKRPSHARKDTTKTKAKRQAAFDEGVRITMPDGEDFVVRLGDISPATARRFRREVGIPPFQLIEELFSAPDIDSIAALIWLARLIRGEEDAQLDDAEVSYADLLNEDITFAESGAEKVGEDPEA